jgi:hypothetical protein
VDLVLGGRQTDRQGEREREQADPEHQREQEGHPGAAAHVWHGSVGHPHRGHSRVVHAGDRDAHDQRRDDRGADTADPGTGPQRGGPGHDRDQYRQQEQRHVVVLAVWHAHRRHAHVVHGGHAEADDDAPDQQRPPATVTEADDEQADAYDGDRDQHRPDGDRDVVEDLLPGNREAEHGDEVHRPDPRRPDAHRREAQPARPLKARVRPGPRHAA